MELRICVIWQVRGPRAEPWGPFPNAQSLMRNVKKEKGQPTDDAATEEIVPTPG